MRLSSERSDGKLHPMWMIMMLTICAATTYLVLANPSDKTRASSEPRPMDGAIYPKIELSAASPSESSDRKAIIELVERFYEGLLRKNYQQAANCYEAGAFDDSGLNPVEALKAATEIDGRPPEIPQVVNLNIQGDSASGDIMIQRDGEGPISTVLIDSRGNVQGTWARRLRFVKENGDWKIAAKGTPEE